MFVSNKNPRYNGKPLLRFLECYVLEAIGELTEEQAKGMENLTPTLQQALQLTGTWQEMVAQTMEFPPTLPDELNVLWRKNLDIAKANGVELLPQKFAEMIVDQNFI